MAVNLYRWAQITESEIKPAALNPRPSTFISDFILLIDRPGKGRDRMGQFKESFQGGHYTTPLYIYISLTTQNAQNCVNDHIVFDTIDLLAKAKILLLTLD